MKGRMHSAARWGWCVERRLRSHSSWAVWECFETRGKAAEERDALVDLGVDPSRVRIKRAPVEAAS